MSVLPTTTYKVRIVCRTFNHARYIKDALNGFCIQETKFPFVAIIIDDASTDGEAKIISSYLEDHFDMVHAQYDENDDAKRIAAVHKNNPNCHFLVILLKYNFHSINKPQYPLYKGWYENVPYIATCEGDDYWTDPLKLQKQVDFLDTHPDYFMCSHDFKVYSEAQKKITALTSYPNIAQTPFTYTLDNYFQGDWIQTLTCLYRNGNKYPIPTNKYKYFRDRISNYYLLKNGKGCLLPDVMGVYRKHSGGVLSGKKAEENYYIYMSIALDIYHIENEPRALQLLRRHALGLFNYRWNHHQKKELIRDFRYLFAKAPFSTTTGLLISFIGSMLKNKLSI